MKNKMISLLASVYTDSLIKNAIYIMMTSFSSLALGFLFWMIAVRYYTPSDIGITSAALSGIFLISTISTIGLPIALTFYLPRYPKNANIIINSCLIIGIIMSTIFSLISVLKIDIWIPELRSITSHLELTVIFVIITVMTTVSLLVSGTFTAGKRNSFHMIKENVFNIIRIIFIMLFSSLGAIGIFISWSIGLIMSMIVGFFLMFKLWKYKPTLSFDPVIKKMAGFSVGNHIAGIFYNLPRFMLPIIIVDVMSAESTGYFFIAMTIASLLYGIPAAVSGPFLAESSDRDKFWNNVHKAVKFNIYLLVPGLLAFMIFGRFVLNIFNPAYAENAFMTLTILSVASIPQALIVIFDTVRSAQKRITITIIVNGIVAVITFVLSVPLMKMWNIEGAAISYLVANTVVAIAIIIKMENPIEFILVTLKGYKIKNDKEGDKNVIPI